MNAACQLTTAHSIRDMAKRARAAGYSINVCPDRRSITIVGGVEVERRISARRADEAIRAAETTVAYIGLGLNVEDVLLFEALSGGLEARQL